MLLFFSFIPTYWNNIITLYVTYPIKQCAVQLYKTDVISTSPKLYYLGTPRAYNVCLPFNDQLTIPRLRGKTLYAINT
jgi:hypothetical protein